MSVATATLGTTRRTTAAGRCVVGAVAATAVAAAAHAAGVSLAVQDGDIPLAAFAQMALLGAVLGAGILAGLNRFSAEPGRRFVQTCVALTVLSCVPSVLLAPAIATKLTLVATHLVSAAVIIPALARHARG